VVDMSGVGAAASGKSGGFLARSWGSGLTEQLHEVSFDMHAMLAEKLGLSSYRKIRTLSVDGSKKGHTSAAWLDGMVTSSLMDDNTAQVTSMELTSRLMEEAVAGGAELQIGRVEGLVIEEGKVKGVRVQGRDTISAEIVVLAMGPWTGPLAEDWLGINLPMVGIKSTSFLFQGCNTIAEDPYACFCEEDRNGCHLELYPRPNGDLYVCGCGGSDHVRGDRLREGGDCENPEKILPNIDRIKAAQKSLHTIVTAIPAAPDISQACMRPCTPDGLPVMGKVPGIEGVYLSTGHNCWGILWAPASGLAMTELILDGRSSTIDLTPFSPNRFNTSTGRGKRGRN